MPRETSPSGILEWIIGNVRPGASDSAGLRYERIEPQASAGLPEIHTPLNAHDPAHWFRRGLIWDYVLALEGAASVLDVGPGEGWPSLLLAPHFREVVGIEPGPRRVAACRANAARLRVEKARFEEMSACRMAFADGSFDGVVAASAIEQTPDPTAALREIFRVLKPGGVLRMSYEAVEEQAEPVREALAVRAGPEGSYCIDYVLVRREPATEEGFLLEVVPATEAQRARLAQCAERCSGDGLPHRDPRLERGLAQTVLAIEKREIAGARRFTLHHFRTRFLLSGLQRIGFENVRLIVGGGWPARQVAQELARSQRSAAGAPLMEELCRAGAAIGLALETVRPGEVIARKPSGRAPVRKAGGRAGGRGVPRRPSRSRPGAARAPRTSSRTVKRAGKGPR